jgi:hypothetical protein
VLLVPANPQIFSGLDEELGHYRRYTKEELLRALGAAGFNVNDLISHNLIGALGWWWVGKIRGRRTLQARDTKNFDKLVPVLKHLDPYMTKMFGGVSLIAIASSRNETTTVVEIEDSMERDRPCGSAQELCERHIDA